jgi:hypothetical protein
MHSPSRWCLTVPSKGGVTVEEERGITYIAPLFSMALRTILRITSKAGIYAIRTKNVPKRKNTCTLP